MAERERIPADRLVLGLLSAFRTLVLELEQSGALLEGILAFRLNEIAETHRTHGDPNQIAGALDAIARHIATSKPGPEAEAH